VEGDEGELLRVPDDDLLGDPGEVDTDHRGDEGELGGEVAGGRAVDGVADAAVLEAEVLGDRLRVQTEAAARERTGAVRRHRGPLVPLPQALGVPGEGLRVGQHVVGEQHGLGVLEMGAAGHRDVRVRLGEADERALELGDQAADDPGVVAQVHPEERRHLVVARAAGPQLAAEVRAELLQQTALQGGVDVLVGDGADEGAVRDGGLQPVEAREHTGQLVVVEEVRLVQHARVGP
jgi:hypothetical protein